MGWLVMKKAKELHRRHPGLTFPLDMDMVARAEGCELVDWPFLKPVREVKQGRWIGLAKQLSQRERRYLIAHALAHHLLHTGNQLSFHQHRIASPSKQEREADECAAHILMPEEELTKMSDMSPWELAEYFDVPEELVKRRLTEFATDDELARWESACQEHFPE